METTTKHYKGKKARGWLGATKYTNAFTCTTNTLFTMILTFITITNITICHVVIVILMILSQAILVIITNNTFMGTSIGIMIMIIIMT